jgi:hypothetical protein
MPTFVGMTVGFVGRTVGLVGMTVGFVGRTVGFVGVTRGLRRQDDGSNQNGVSPHTVMRRMIRVSAG